MGMKSEDLLRAMNDIDDTYIVEADPMKNEGDGTSGADSGQAAPSKIVPVRKRIRWQAVVIGAAAALFVLGMAGRFLRPMTNKETMSMNSASSNDYGQPGASLAGGTSEYAMKNDTAMEYIADESNGYYAEDADEAEYEEAYESNAYEPDAYASGTEEAAPYAAADEPEVESAEGLARAEEKLVYTCYLTMQTLSYQETVGSIRERIKALGGMIEAENETDSNTQWYDERSNGGTMHLYMTVRIPTKYYEAFLSSLGGNGRIISKNATVENISREYHDKEAIIRNLEKQEERLDAMMAEAETVEEMILIEDRLSEVQTELDRYRTQLSSMDLDVAYSTIYLTIDEVVQYTKEPEKTETFSDRLYNALTGSAEFFLQFLEDALFFLIYLLPILALVAVLALAVRAVIRRRARKRAGKEKTPKE